MSIQGFPATRHIAMSSGDSVLYALSIRIGVELQLFPHLVSKPRMLVLSAKRDPFLMGSLLMPISSYTLIEVLEHLEGYRHDDITRILIRFGIEDVAPESSGTKSERIMRLTRFLLADPGRKGPFGSDLSLEIVEHLVTGLATSLGIYSSFEETYPRLVRTLERDGFVIDGGKLVPQIPPSVTAPGDDSELYRLLDEFGFATSKGHLEQAIAAHTRGEWASANAQLRSFTESLFDEIARTLFPSEAASASSSEERRRLLASMPQPFVLPDLNEWDVARGNGFIQGFWRRLHPQGSHPGLSDEDDSTFRLRLVALVAHHLLARLHARR